MPPQPAPEQPQKRLGHSVGDTFTLPKYEGRGEERKINGEYTFTVSEHDGHSATVTSDGGGEYKMSKDAVKHFSDDLNQRVDVPEHPSHAGINAVRDGSAQFLGKGDDGMVFDTGDGQVAKVTTSVPYNLAYFREHRHAIADARKQAELTNQAIADGHDLLVPQQFIEHGEKGFTTMPRLDLDAKLSREQITAYRKKMQAFHDAGWEVNDRVQTGVDDQGNIRIYDTGKLRRRDMAEERHYLDEDHWDQLKHPHSLMTEHGHYDDHHNDKLLQKQLDSLTENQDVTSGKPHLNDLEHMQIHRILDDMIANDHENPGQVIDRVREIMAQSGTSEKSEQTEQKLAEWESSKTNEVMDARMIDAQAKFADLVTEYKGIDEDDEPSWTPEEAEESLGYFSSESQAKLETAIDGNSRSTMILMDPNDFIRMAENLPQENQIQKESIESALNAGQPLDDIPSLRFENSGNGDAKVVSHEGRHRAMAFARRGLKLPVEFVSSDGNVIRWNKQGIPGDFDRVAGIWPKRLFSQNTGSGDAIPFPVNDPIKEPDGESLDDLITDRGLFEQMVPDLDAPLLALLAFKSYESYGEDINLAGFAMDEDAIGGYDDDAKALKAIAAEQEKLGLNLKGEELEAGQETMDGGHYEPPEMPDMDLYMRNQYPEGYFWGPAGFLMADGALLDMGAGGGDSRGDDHRSIIPSEEAADRWGWNQDGQGDTGEGSNSRWSLLIQTLHHAGAIRVDGPSGLLHMETSPTNEQQRMIAKYINDYEPERMSIRFGNGGNEALQEWEVENPTASLVLSQIERAGNGERIEPPGDFQQLPKDEWPDYHRNLVDSEQGNYAYISIDEYLGTIPEETLDDLEENVIASEIEDKQYDMEQGEMFPPLLFYNNGQNAESVALALAARNLGWDQVPVITEPDYKPEIEAPDTAKFREFWGNSRVVNADGTPQAQMHGTTTDDELAYFNTMGGRDFGSHFGDIDQANEFVETNDSKKIEQNEKWYDSARIYPVWLSIQNPLVTDDLGRWEPDEIVAFMEEKLEEKGIPWPEFIDDDGIPDRNDWNDEVMELVPEVMNEHAWHNNHLGAWGKFKERKNWIMLRDAMEAAGYDGIAYLNMYEGNGGDGQLSFIALRPEQIKSAIGNKGAYDKTDKRITYAADDDAGIDRPATPEPSTPEPSTPKRPVWDKSAGQGQGLQANAETRGKERETKLADDSPAVHPDHMEPYEHVKPEPLPTPEPDQSARDELKTRWTQAGFGEAPQDTSGIRSILSRNRDMALKDKTFLPDQNDLLKNMDLNEIDALQDRAHPKPPQQPTGWENDDHLYHIAKVDNAEQIMAEGLRPNQPTNFADNLQWNIEGNVFLTEKQGVQTWQEHVGEMAESKLENQSRSLAWDLNAAQASLSELVERGPHKNYDAERVEIQKEINKLTKQKEAINGRVQEHERDTTGHTKVFRVPKSKIQDYIAIDEAGTRDAQADAFKLNNYVTDRVKWAKQQTGMAEQDVSRAGAEQKRLGGVRRSIQSDIKQANIERSESRSDFSERWSEYFNNRKSNAIASQGREFRVTGNEGNVGPSVWALPGKNGLYAEMPVGMRTPIVLEVKDHTHGNPGKWTPVYRGYFDPADDGPDGWTSKSNETLSADMFADFQSHVASLSGVSSWQRDMLPDGDLLAPQDWQPIDQSIPRASLNDEQVPFIEKNNILFGGINYYYADKQKAWEKHSNMPIGDIPGVTELSTINAYLRDMKETQAGTTRQGLGPWWSSGKAHQIRLDLPGAVGVHTHKLDASGDAYTHIAMMKELFAGLDRKGNSFGSQFENWAMTELFAEQKKGELKEWDEENLEEYNKVLTTLAKGQLRNLQLNVASNPNYWRWAKDNHAVDDEGLPLIIFHGTRRGGFDEFGNLDVEGHIYGSTDVATGSTYSGGFTDDVTPVFATDVYDIEHTLNTTENYSLEAGEDGYKVIQLSRRDGGPIGDPVIEAATEDELIVAWNSWIARRGPQGDRPLNTRGVYPLVYRLTNPMVVEGNGSNWNSIPLFAEHDGTPESLLADPMFQARMKTKTKTTPFGQMYGNAKMHAESEINKYDKRGMDYRKAFESLKQYSNAILLKHGNQHLHDHDVLAEASRIYSDALGEDFSVPIGLGKKAGSSRSDLPPNTVAGPDYLLLDTFSVGVHDTGTTRELSEIAEAAGHDGIIFKNIIDDGGQGGPDQRYGGLDPADVYVSFTTAQVKSAHNGGNFAEFAPDRNKLMYSATA